MSLGFWQIVFLIVLFLLFFGRGKIPQLMGDIAEGIKSFKKGMSEQGQGQAARENVDGNEIVEKKV